MRLGLDPEMALVSKKTGLARSAHLFPYVDEPKPWKPYGWQPAYQQGAEYAAVVERDGCAIEVRNLNVSACRDFIIPFVGNVLQNTQLALEKWNPKLTLSSAPSYKLDSWSLRGEYPRDVVEFGCRPDWDAYNLRKKDPRIERGDLGRYTGGHVHLSPISAEGNSSLEHQARVAVLFDYLVAVPMVAMLGEKFKAGEVERRRFYGQPGSFRYHKKGDHIEFRVLSGRLMLSPILLSWVLGAAKKIRFEAPHVERVLDKLVQIVSPDEVCRILFQHDVDGAREVGDRVLTALWGEHLSSADVNSAPNSGFFTHAFRFISDAAAQGVHWEDDVKLNWGLFDGFKIVDHNYWGVHGAMFGWLDDTIFPQRVLLEKYASDNKLAGIVHTMPSSPYFVHPVNGGGRRLFS